MSAKYENVAYTDTTTGGAYMVSAPSKDRHHKLHHFKSAKACGITQIVCGILAVLIGIGAILFDAFLMASSVGFWAGFYLILGGTFSIIQSKNRRERTTCPMVTTMVLNIIAAVCAGAGLVISCFATPLDYERYLNCGPNSNNYYTDHLFSNLGINWAKNCKKGIIIQLPKLLDYLIAWMVFDGIAIIIFLIGTCVSVRVAGLACRGACCCQDKFDAPHIIYLPAEGNPLGAPQNINVELLCDNCADTGNFVQTAAVPGYNGKV